MSCDLSEPTIAEAYQQILSGEIKWLLLGYMDTREKLFLYQKGNGGLDELRSYIKDDVMYALLHYNDHLVYVVYVYGKLKGAKRARTVIHGKAIANYFEQFDVPFYMTKVEDLTEVSIEIQIKNKGNSTDFFDQITHEVPTNPLPPIPQTASNVSETGLAPDVSKEKLSYRTSILEAGAHEEDMIKHEIPTSPFKEPVLKIDEPSQSPVKPESQNRLAESKESKEQIEAVAKRKIQEAWQKRESIKIQFDHDKESTDGSQLSGYITILGGGCFFWKRRWFVLRGETLYFYRDPSDHYPVSCLDLGGSKSKVEDASLDTLIPHCFKLDLTKDTGDKEIYYFFADSEKLKQSVISGILQNQDTIYNFGK